MSSVSKFGRRIQETQQETGGVSLAYINDNYVKVDGKSVMLRNLNMGGSYIKNLREPSNPNDAANKNYVESVKGTSFFSKNENGVFVASQSLNMGEKTITGLPLPIQDDEATTKVYTDTSIIKLKRDTEKNNPFIFQNDEYTAKDKVNMRGFKIENAGEGENPGDLATLKNVSQLVPFEKKNGGYEATTHLYLGKKKLGGLRDPEQSREAANKKYVDEKATEVLKKFIFDDIYQLDKNLNMRNNRIYGLDEPQREDEAANKKYVDGKIIAGGNVQPAEIQEIKNNQAFTIRNGGGRTYDAKGNLNMKGKKIRNLEDATEKNGVITKGYVDEIKTYFEEKLNDLEIGDMKGKKILNLGEPENPNDAATKKYVDDVKVDLPFLRENGYFVATSGLNMAFKKIENVPDPEKNNDAANKNYIDKFLKKENDKLKISVGSDLQEFNIRLNENREKYIQDINTLKEDILKIKTKSIFLIRGEAKGPIKNLSQPDYNPTRVLFGAYDGGIMQTVANRDISFSPNFIIPFKSRILKYGITVKQFEDKRERGKLKIQLKINEFDENKPLIMGLDGVYVTGEEQNYNLEVDYNDNYIIKCGEFTPVINLKKCSSLTLNFDLAYPNIERVYITLAAEIEN